MKEEEKMKNPISGIKDIKSGKLSEIMSYYMLNDSEKQNDFLKIAEKNKGKFKNLLKEYKSFYGYEPSKDIIELEESFDAYSKHMYSISDVWMLEGGISYVSGLLKKEIKPEIFNDWRFLVTILTGLELFGRDPSGDSCFIDTLPNPFDTTQVLVYDHETGEPSGYTAYSLADFVSDTWDEYYDNDTDEEFEKNTDETKKIIDQFNTEAKKFGKKRPYYHNPKTLFDRVHWILGHPTGRPTYEFAAKLGNALVFADWEKEKKLVTTVPVLANYWLLAHFFLGNTNACKELITLTKQSDSMVTKKLAELIENLIKNPAKAKLGKLDSKKLKKLLDETRKNCIPEQLEPESRKAILKERGEDKINKLSSNEFKKRIAEGVNPMAIIEEFPEDVATHDKALEIIAKQKKNFNKIFKQYLNQRESDAYSEWPYDAKDLDKCLSLPASAAFISGLKYDESHKLANSGITITLGKFDDDNTMNAYYKALNTLNPNDERIEYLLKYLEKSKHPRKNELLVFAAWELFKRLDKAKENEDALKERRDEEGLTLDNMFGVKNHFLHPVHVVLKMNNEDSVNITNEILKKRDLFKLFRRTLGDAFRVAGNKKMFDHKDFLLSYIKGVSNIQTDEDGYIEDVTLYNFSEACTALAKLEPETSKDTLNDLFNRTTNAKFLDLDIKSGTIGGLLLHNPKDKDLLYWLERLLGNRNNNARLCGALRAVAETKTEEALDWAVFHLYSDTNTFMSEHTVIKRLAREAVNSLGKSDLPDFDDDDEYASSVKPENLPEALDHPEKHLLEHVCEKIYKKKYIHKDALNGLKKYLIDQLKFSADEEDMPDLWEAYKALAIQGDEALEVFAELIKLPNISSDCYTDIIYVMRTIEPEAKIREWMYKAVESDIIKQLESPEARFIPWLDLIASHAFCSFKENAEEAVKKALKYRYEMPSSGYSDEEPTSVRLPLIYSAYRNKESINYLNKLDNSLDEYSYAKDSIEKALSYKFEDKSVNLKENSKFKLSNKIKGEDYDCPVYSLVVEYKDKTVSFKCKVENLYFQSFVKDKTLKSEGSISCESVERAKELAEMIVKECRLLKYK